MLRVSSVVFVSVCVVACGAPVGAGPDAGDLDAGDIEVDAGPTLPPECTGPSPKQAPVLPIRNGQSAPTLYTISEGQQLAVGALMTQGRGGWENACTATLVTKDTVLTAAHCVWGRRGPQPATNFQFAIGPDMALPLAMFEVSEVHVQSEYGQNRDSAEFDVAILKLAQDAVAAYPSLEPIRVNDEALGQDLVGQPTQNVGYGLTNPRSQGNTEKFWTTEHVYEVNDIDVVLDGRGQSAVCFGDSGGPLLLQFGGVLRVAGTVSYGEASCLGKDHFARVDKNFAWMDRDDIGGPLLTADEPIDPGACLGFTEAGVCEGETARKCVRGRIVSEDCGATGKLCSTAGGPASCIADPCNGLDFLGTCEGTVAAWCQDGVVKTFDCGVCGMACGWTGWSIGAFCQ